MKIISTKKYNELKKTQSAYFDLLMKPLQGVFKKVTDDDLLRENALVYAENKKLHSIIKEVREYIKEMPNSEYIGYWKKEIFEILDKGKE